MWWLLILYPLDGSIISVQVPQPSQEVCLANIGGNDAQTEFMKATWLWDASDPVMVCTQNRSTPIMRILPRYVDLNPQAPSDPAPAP